jgi:hypothetical protein
MEECDNMSPKARRWQDVDKTQIPVAKLIKSFLMYQEDRNHSPKTVEWYEGMLGRFSRFLGEEAKAGELDLEAVRRYQRFLRGEQLSKFTLHAYLTEARRRRQSHGLSPALSLAAGGLKPRHCPLQWRAGN